MTLDDEQAVRAAVAGLRRARFARIEQRSRRGVAARGAIDLATGACDQEFEPEPGKPALLCIRPPDAWVRAADGDWTLIDGGGSSASATVVLDLLESSSMTASRAGELEFDVRVPAEAGVPSRFPVRGGVLEMRARVGVDGVLCELALVGAGSVVFEAVGELVEFAETPGTPD